MKGYPIHPSGLDRTYHKELKTHEMGMQISRGIHPEVLQEKYLWVGETGIKADHASVSCQTALSGSQIKPPALPEVHDSNHSRRSPFE